VSKEEQKGRFLRRLDHPDKTWKFSAADVAERRHWDDYQSAYEEAITATSTDWAPWFVIPADRKPVMQAMVASVLVHAIKDLDLRWPTVSKEEKKAAAAARRELEEEEE
jgi:polyphosphate kinase 2 (PPK2 family)